MTRVLLVAMGVPSFLPARRHAGPGLRAAHFAKALRAAGHDVLVVAVLAEDEPVPDTSASPVPVLFTTEKLLPGDEMRRRLDAFAAEAVVGVTAYAAALAVRLRTNAPLWADVFGDLMAEAQAKAARSGNDWSLVHFWTLMRVVLEHADRFSAVSVAQGHALLGQLGLAGRLSARTAGEDLVAVIPCAAEPAFSTPSRDEARAALGLATDAFVLLASGGVNTWCDVDTLAAGVAAAMRENDRVHLVVTGGAIPGHDETSVIRLTDGLREADAARVHVLGWIDDGQLATVYAAADLGLHIEEKLAERVLGGENRVVEWMAHGLVAATTAQSETGRQLVDAALAWEVAQGDASALARVVREAASAPSLLRERGAMGRRWVATHRGGVQTAAPLLRWCLAPCSSRDHDGARLVRLGLMSHPETSVEMLEAYVAALPLRTVARRGLRWLWRRTAAFAVRPVVAMRTRSADACPDTLRAAKHKTRVVLSLFLALLASTLGAGCTKDGAGAGTTRPNVLLLSVDTLRADHVGAFGAKVKPSPTPWIDRLASGGVVFEQAFTSAPETAPALATLVTGQYQDRHGVLYNRAKLEDTSNTLAERLKAAGYTTASFVGNWLVDATHGFAQGVDRSEVVTAPAGVPVSIDDRVVDRAGSFLRTTPGDKPWLLWVHLVDPHGPYNSAPVWWSRGLDYSAAPLTHGGDYPVSDSNFGLGVIPRYQKLDDAKTLSDYVRRYDGEIRFMDSQVGALLGILAATGHQGDTIVVLVADHGESLDEHGELLQHGWFVHDTTTHVPLVVWWPGVLTPARVREQACSVDIVPTILDLTGIGGDSADFDGRSLAPELGQGSRQALTGTSAELRAAGCFTTGPRYNHLFSLRTARYKLIVTPAGAPTDPRSLQGTVTDEPERVQLFDLFDDPGETVDIQAERAERTEQMQQPLGRLRARFRANGWRW